MPANGGAQKERNPRGMSRFAGSKTHVTLETQDGLVIDGTGCTVEVEQESWMPGAEPIWTITVRGYGNLYHRTREEQVRHVADKRTASEWKCEFCGSVNLREHRNCQKCNAARSFLYD